MQIKFKKLSPLASAPHKAHPSDAGYDLTATSLSFDDHGCAVYGTGIAVAIPEGHVGLLFPRSSIAKKEITLTNSVGVIDAGYRGEIMAKFKPTQIFTKWNEAYHQTEDRFSASSLKPSMYQVGDRICQLIVIPIPEVEFSEVDDLDSTDRGTGGYGSSDWL